MYTLVNAPPGVYRVVGGNGPTPFAALSRSRGIESFHANGRRVRTKKRFLAVVARTLRLPRWFGMNWDALADSLTDREWQAHTSHALLLTDFNAFAAHAPCDFAAALAVLQDAVDFWADREVRFLVLVDCKHRSCLQMPTVQLR
jgi:hypothetical protein